MAMIVQHNITAMNANRQLGINTTQKAKHAERLASGYRINRAADDAAGLAISEKMRSQIRGLAMGTRNTEEGISLCHVADGALNEVHAMMNRLKELSVQAANGTNCESDREMIQDEVEQILEEVDRIGNDTEFNTMLIFKGGTETIVSEPGLGSVPFDSFELANIRLDDVPLQPGNDPNMLYLAAIVNDPTSVYNEERTRLIYGDGSTSSSSLRITIGGISTVVRLDGSVDTNGDGSTDVDEDGYNWVTTSTNYTSNGIDSWTKEYSVSDGTSQINIIQHISIEETSDIEKNYVISYEFTQTGDVDKLEFMFHADTAYNGTNEGDYQEGYYINGNRLTHACVYDTGTNLVAQSTSQYLYNETPPSSFKIYNEEDPLQFCEQISFQSGEEPDSLSIGHWSSIDDWTYYGDLDTRLNSIVDRDIGFSLYYDLSDASRNNKVTFKYGICSEIPVNPPPEPRPTIITEHSESLDLWIQSGPNEGEGMYLTIGEMNTEVLGIRNLDVSTFKGAQEAMTKVDIASKKVSSIRSAIGAQQNRLEHTVLYNENTMENTTAAESRLRDADMAEELVIDAKYNILMQTSQSMLAQANNMTEGILQLLNA